MCIFCNNCPRCGHLICDQSPTDEKSRTGCIYWWCHYCHTHPECKQYTFAEWNICTLPENKMDQLIVYNLFTRPCKEGQLKGDTLC